MRGAAGVCAPREWAPGIVARADPALPGRHGARRGRPYWPLIAPAAIGEAGLALVRLAQGDVSNAAASIRDALRRPMRVPFKERPPDTDLQRAPLLEAQVEIEIAAGDIARARSAADELTRVAARFESRALVAGAAHAHGRVRLAEGAPADAERFCAEAARLWSEIGAPYEAALARAGLADALRASGSEQRAAFELQAARAVLDRIEAEPTADDAAPVGERRSRVTDLDMFRREGDYWSVSFEGRTVQVRDLKGIRYLARLLADPGREFHVLDLVAAESGRSAEAASGPGAGVSHTGTGDAGEMLDARAKDAYRRRLAEIEDDIEQARALEDTEREMQADAERDFLVRELQARARPAAAALPAPGGLRRPEVFGILDDLVAAGKLRYYGVSVETVDEALARSGIRTCRPCRSSSTCSG